MCLWCYRRKKCRVRKPSAVALQQSMAHGGKGVYGVALKWEKHNDSTDWCEARLVTKPKVARLMKWVMFQHLNLARVGGFLHSRFPSWGFLISTTYLEADSWSPNAPTILKSMVRTLTQKFIILAKTDVYQNSAYPRGPLIGPSRRPMVFYSVFWLPQQPQLSEPDHK